MRLTIAATLAFAMLTSQFIVPRAPAAGDWFNGTDRSVACSGDITSALSTAIGASSDRDVVSIGAGSCTMTSVSVTNKKIKIKGAGDGVTNISTGSGSFISWSFTSTNQPNFRMTAMSVSGTCASCTAITVTAQGAAEWKGPFLFDHMTLTYSSTNADGGIFQLWGPLFGVMSNLTVTNCCEAAILTDLSISTEDGSSVSNLYGAWAASNAFSPGSGSMLYIEDSTFTGSTTTSFDFVTDTFYRGVRLVFRHNTTTNAGLFAHWTSGGNWNSAWWEVYNNKLSAAACCTGNFYPMRFEGGGTGLIYNNTVSGFDNNFILANEERISGTSSAPLLFCDGTHNWDGSTDTDVPGWPCLSQTGRDAGKTMTQIQAGTKQASFPLYLWNNGGQDKCYNPSAAGAACDNSFTVMNNNSYLSSSAHTTTGFGNGDVDWSKTTSQPSGAGTHTLTYTPYTYPHPCVASFSPTCAS